jgi:hypothetical protein
VSPEETLPEADANDARAQLRKGLRSCQAVVDSYRRLIANEQKRQSVVRGAVAVLFPGCVVAPLTSGRRK